MEDKKYRGYYADCYVLTNQRSEKFVQEFLEHFLPEREESADEYEVPQHYNEPQHLFTSIDEIVEYLVENPHEPYSLYWRNKSSSDIKGGMLFFTSDGYIITGLYCDSIQNDPVIENIYLNKLKVFCKSERGYIDYENPPLLSASDFPA